MGGPSYPYIDGSKIQGNKSHVHTLVLDLYISSKFESWKEEIPKVSPNFLK